MIDIFFPIILTFLVNFSIFDPQFDYSHFLGRLTDRDKLSNTLKIKVETSNIRFLRSADALKFSIPTINTNFCQANVQDIQESNGNYLTIYTPDIKACWDDNDHLLRRGMQISFVSPTLQERVVAAEQMRQVYIKQKEDFLIQLNSINNFLYTFNEQITHAVSNYDKKLHQLQQERQQQIDQLLSDKENKIKIQKELVKKVEWIKNQLKYYQIERIEPVLDRWNQDLKTGFPVVPKEKGHPDTPNG